MVLLFWVIFVLYDVYDMFFASGICSIITVDFLYFLFICMLTNLRNNAIFINGCNKSVIYCNEMTIILDKFHYTYVLFERR